MTSHDAAFDKRNDDLKIWLNGALVPKARAVVSVYDNGFMLGDGIWEGLRLYNGRFAFLDEHLDRLYQAAKAINLDITLPRAALADALEQTRLANGMESDAHARLMITRGVNAAFSAPGPACG